MIAKIAVSAAVFAIDKPYSYGIPEGMTLSPGQRVTVPFGRANKLTEGVVLLLEEGNEEGLKEVREILDPEPILTPLQLKLAAFLRERYFCTFYEAIRAMLPAGLWFQTREHYALTQDRSWKEATIRKEGAREILELLTTLGGETHEDALTALGLEETVLQEATAYLVRKNGSRRIRSICAGARIRPKKSRPWYPLRRKPENMPNVGARRRLSRKQCWSCCVTWDR